MSSIPVPGTRPLMDIARARAQLAEADLDAIVANSMRNIFYMTGFPIFDALIEPEASAFAVLRTSGMDLPSVTVAVSERYYGKDFPLFAREVYYANYYVKNAPALDKVAGSAFDALIDMITAAAGANGRVGFELDQLPVTLHQRIAKALPNLTMVDAAPIFRELRMIKTEEEVDRVRRAVQLTEQSIDEAFVRIRVGTSENEIARWINEGIIARGGDPLYVTLGIAGRGAYGVNYPTDRKVTKGEVVRADVAARYGHYHSDLGRCCVVGPASAEQTEYYRVGYEGLRAGIESIKAGQPIGEVFDAALKVPHTTGHPEFKRHHIGHGIGLQAHEWPFLKPGVRDPIRTGMVLAVEVPYYVYDLGGFSPEDILVVRDDTIDVFSSAPKELPVVG